MTLNPVAPLNARVPEWTFAERLRKVRRDELKLNQTDMAARLGVKRSTYEAWETGRNKPDVTLLSEHLERLTGITRLWFVGWADTTPNPGPDGGSDVTKTYRKSHNAGSRGTAPRTRVTHIGQRSPIAAPQKEAA